MEKENALKILRELHDKALFSERTALEIFIPELKESEDERIKRQTLKILNYYKDEEKSEGRMPTEIDECIAWLEKQGNSPIKWNKNTEGNKPQVNHSVLMKTTQGIAEGEWKGEYWEQYRWAGIVRNSDVLSWMELSDLDKQGKQKPTLRERYKNIAESEWFKKTHEGMSVSDDEKVDNVNKIETKFKVGDWITNGDYTWKIVEVKPLDYILQSQDGNIVDDTISYIDEEFNLWTIQDAKDGDVLATEDNCICIFDNTVEEGKYPFAYCGLSMYGFKVYDRTLPFTHDDVYPATKEQRELLFQKMKEAGYEWDSVKKELRKIEQGPTIEMKSAEESLGIDSETYNKIVDECIYGDDKQKPAWSEGDENYLNTTIAYLKDANEFKKTAEKCITWLKSLKPQNTWKPSDEQMDALESAIVDSISSIQKHSLESLYNELKKLF